MKLKSKRIVSILICSILGLIGLGYFIYPSFVTTVQFIQNPARTHNAYLIRHNGTAKTFIFHPTSPRSISTFESR